MKIRDIKQRALGVLGENFSQALIVMLLYLATYFGLTVAEAIAVTATIGGELTKEIINANLPIFFMIMGIRYIVEFFVISPLSIGTTWWLIHASRGETNNIGYIFICFKNIKIYVKSVLLRAEITMAKILLSIPVIICVYILNLLRELALKDIGNSGNYILLGVCCTLIMIFLIVMVLWITLGFELCNPIFSLDPDRKIREIILASISAMKNNKIKMIKLMLSFIGWFAASVFVVPLFFVIPYFAMSYAVLVNDIMSRELYLSSGALGRRYLTYNSLR